MKRNGDSLWLVATLGMVALIGAVAYKKSKDKQTALTEPVAGLGRIPYPDGSWSK